VPQKESAAWTDESVAEAHVALSHPEHRGHIGDHLKEVTQALKAMQEKSIYLENEKLSIQEAENIAEEIDEATHLLQYKIDHCRR
jgi:hypothetical protein